MIGGVRTESIENEKNYLKKQADFLISALQFIFHRKLRSKDIRKRLYIAYGLNETECEILLKTSKGIILPESRQVNQKCMEELIKFLSFIAQYNGIIEVVIAFRYEF